MNFFKKIFNFSNKQEQEKIKNESIELSLDDSFVHHFINKGGKFLYCTSTKEVLENIKKILDENNWNTVICNDFNLNNITKKIDIKVVEKLTNMYPFFTTCEHLIADKGDILFSSNQLSSTKLNQLSNDFIVYATTSQLVKNTGEGLTGIKINFSGNIPTNISSIKNFTLKKEEDSFMNYGNSNAKNLYLLLFEDL